jgi:hypothetical protein
MLRVTCTERVCECAATVAATPCKEVAANVGDPSPTHILAPALLPMTDEAHVSPVPSQDAVARVASNQVRSHARSKTTCRYILPCWGRDWDTRTAIPGDAYIRTRPILRETVPLTTSSARKQFEMIGRLMGGWGMNAGDASGAEPGPGRVASNAAAAAVAA